MLSRTQHIPPLRPEDEDDDLLEGEDSFALYYIFYMETMMAVEYSQWQ